MKKRFFCFLLCLMLLGSVFTAKAQLFEAKDNAQLLAMPIPPGQILFSRMASLILINGFFQLTVAVPAAVCWVLHCPVTPMGAAAFLLFCLCLPLTATAVSALLAEGSAAQADLAAAMKEAVLNAILHADYFGGGGLTIQRTDAELQVTNGGLLRVSPDQARAGGAADPRNVVLTRLFSLVKLGSGAGKGLKGIYHLWAQQGWSAPVLSEAFKAGVTSLSLPLPRREFSPEDLTRQLIAEYLTEQVSATEAALAEALGLTPREVQTALAYLKEKELVVEQEDGYHLRA